MRNIVPYLCLVLLISCFSLFGQSQYKLWYDEPARYFEESLPLGNGQTGACVFGGVTKDSILLNDATLWTGEPVDSYMNPEAYKMIPVIREALANEDYKLADELNRKVQGKFSESFAPLGTLILEFTHDHLADRYYRELDIRDAIAGVHYEISDNTYKREYFISHPDSIMVIRLSAGQKGSLNCKLQFESLLRYTITTENEVFKVDGYAPYHAEPGYRGDMAKAVRFDPERGTRFSTYIKVQNDGGTLSWENRSIVLKNSDSATIFISIATSFNGFDKDPAKEGKDHSRIALEQLNQAVSKGHEPVKNDHVEDYRSFFNRLELSLGESTVPDLPTDERLKKYTEGEADKNLEILYFQFGRYLLISSSRTPGVPANLQGIWNPYLRPPWSSNYTMNINVEENYWLAETGNLSEMHKPLLGFIGNLSKTGEITAKTFYGVNKGWAACHNSDIWAMSNPVGDFGEGHPVWACWNMSGPWLVSHLWEHYQFTGEEEFLRTYAWPLMKGAAEFCLDWMVKDKNGRLITSPSTSPENLYRTSGGYEGATLYGATSDLAMIRECFIQTIDGADVLNIDRNFLDDLETALGELYPYQVGSQGNLQEWYHDWEYADPKHRHQSHLFGLYPGSHITPEKTPELADACKTTLEIKGDETTGWSKGWRINLWARLNNGNRAYKMFRELLRYVEPDQAKKTKYSGGGGTYPNLFDAHPPFQIDGNFGGAAGVLEMLVQSHNGKIRILPSLPEAWPEGSLKGVCARGGFECCITWEKGTLTEIVVKSKNGNRCLLVYRDHKQTFDTEKGKHYRFDASLQPK